MNFDNGLYNSSCYNICQLANLLIFKDFLFSSNFLLRTQTQTQLNLKYR